MLAALVQQLIDVSVARLLTVATVTGTVGNLVTIRRAGEVNPDAQSYPRLASYAAPVNGDECLCLRLGTGTLIIGRITR